MKKLILSMIFLMMVGCGGTALATEWVLGHEANLQLTDRSNLDVTVGMFVEDCGFDPQVFGKANFTFLGAKNLPSLHFVLGAEQYGVDHTILSGAYIYPVKKDLEFQVGLRWEKLRGETSPRETVSLAGQWWTDYGLLEVGIMGGKQERVHLLYEGEVELLKHFFVGVGAGLQYDLYNGVHEWNVPVHLGLTYDFSRCVSLKMQASDLFPLGEEREHNLGLGFFVQTRWDWRSKPKVEATPTVESEEVETVEPEPVNSTPSTTETASLPPEKVVPEASGSAETIPVVHLTQETKVEQPTTAEEKKETTTEITPVAAESPSETASVEPESVKTETTEERETEVETPAQEPSQEKPVNSYDPATGLLELDGQSIQVNEIMKNGEAYIPIRQTIQQLGGQVYWYVNPRQIRIVLKDTRVLIQINDATYMRNGQMYMLEGGLELWEGHYFIHVDQFIEMMGAI